jgi:hypothetical protein
MTRHPGQPRPDPDTGEEPTKVAEPGRGAWAWMCEESTTTVDGFVAASELVSGRRALLEYGVREDEIPF